MKPHRAGHGGSSEFRRRTGSRGHRHPLCRREANTANPPKLTKFVPFDPATKMSEATAVDAKGGTLRVVKGAFAVVIKLTEPAPTAAATAHELEGRAFGFWPLPWDATTMKLAGIIALSDPPRPTPPSLSRSCTSFGRAHRDGDR
jgi:H+-transporting ATPase